jgi:hypothetical protein
VAPASGRHITGNNAVGGVQVGRGAGRATPPAAGHAPGWVPATGSDGRETLRPATTAAATLGGAAAHKPGDAEPGTMPIVKDPL